MQENHHLSVFWQRFIWFYKVNLHKILTLICPVAEKVFKPTLYMVYCSKYSRPAGPWVQQYKIQIQCLMTGKLNKQAVLSVVSNAIQSKAHRNTKSTLVQHSNVDPLLSRHIKAKSWLGSHRALHKLWNILFHPMTISMQKSTPWTRWLGINIQNVSMFIWA